MLFLSPTPMSDLIGGLHIHPGYGTLRTPLTVFVNASLFGDSGSLDRRPIVIDLQAR